MNLVSSPRSTITPVPTKHLPSPPKRQPPTKTLQPISPLNHQPTPLPTMVIDKQVTIAQPTLSRPNMPAGFQLSSVTTKHKATLEASIKRIYTSPPNPIVRKKLSISTIIEKTAVSPSSLKKTSVVARRPTKSHKMVAARGIKQSISLTQRLTTRDSPQSGKEDKASPLATGLTSGREKSLYKRRVSRSGKKSAKVIKQVGLTYTRRSAPQLVRQRVVPQEINYGPSPKPYSKEVAASTPALDQPDSTKVAYRVGSSSSFSPTNIIAKIAHSGGSTEERQPQKQSLQTDTKRHSLFTIRERVKVSSPKRKLVNKTLIASAISQYQPTTALTRIRPLVYSIDLDVARQAENKPEPSAWTTYINDKFSISNHVSAITLDKYKNKWFGMNTGVVRYNGRRWLSYTSQDGLAADQVHAIALDYQGRLWFGTQGGVSRFDGVSWVNYTTEDGLAHNQVNAVVVDGQKHLWFGTQGGVSRFDGVSWTSYTTEDGLVHNQVNAVVVDGQKHLWFGTQGGVSRFDGVSWTSYTTEDGLVHNQVNAVVVDEQKHLWFGTQGGVSRFDGVSWTSYTTEDGLVHNQVNAVVVDEQERLWFGTQGGVSRFDNDYWLSFGKQDGLASNEVYAVLVESGYRKWFGTDIGVSELTEEVTGQVYR